MTWPAQERSVRSGRVIHRRAENFVRSGPRVLALRYGYRATAAIADHAAARDHLGLWRSGAARSVRGGDRRLPGRGAAAPGAGPGARVGTARRRPEAAGALPEPPAARGDQDPLTLRGARRRRRDGRAAA